MKKKKDFSNVGGHIFSILFILLVLIELQIMVNYPEEFIWFVGVGALILVDVYLLISVSMKRKNISHQRKDEQFENIQKGEKASYLLIKKCFQDLDERMNRMEKAVLPVSNMVELNGHKMENVIAESMLEQRKVAKILLGRSKESGEALLGGNTEIKASLSNFEKKLEQLEEGVSALNMAEPEANGELNKEQYQEILTAIYHLEESLKKHLEEAPVRNTMPQEESIAVQPSVKSEAAMDPMMGLDPEPAMDPIVGLDPEAAMDPMVGLDPEPAPEPDIALEPEAAPASEAAPVMPSYPNSNNAMTPDDIAALLAGIGAGTPSAPVIPEPETAIEPEIKAASGPEIGLEPEAFPEPEIGLEPEAAPASAPVPAPAPAMPDFSDPNKSMTPDDIAALLESMGTDSSGASSSSDMDNDSDLDVLAGLDMLMEEEPQEKSDVPDFSDPNKIMSPDEIAALIANT